MRRISVQRDGSRYQVVKIGDSGWVTERGPRFRTRTEAEIAGMTWAARDNLVVDYPITLAGHGNR